MMTSPPTNRTIPTRNPMMCTDSVYPPTRSMDRESGSPADTLISSHGEAPRAREPSNDDTRLVSPVCRKGALPAHHDRPDLDDAVPRVLHAAAERDLLGV